MPIPQGVRTVRIELADATIGVEAHAAAELRYAGGVRRAADTAAGLKQLEAIPLAMTAALDPADATRWVVKGPAVPPGGPQGVFALELGVHVPADLALEVAVTGNGHVTIANRRAATTVATSRGDLRFERCTGALRAHTGRGMVIAFDHRGDLDIDTAVGDMQVFVREPGEQLRLVTGQGTVQCYVPPETGFEVDARAAVGKIGNGFGLPVEIVRNYGAALVGRHRDGRTRLVLRTGSGHLALSPKAFD